MRTRVHGGSHTLGVIGWPVAHSLSPTIHNSAFIAMEMDWVYVPMPVPPGELPSCAPCRGTGLLVSNLGGEPSQVTCPWCEGGKVQMSGHDAQAARRLSVRFCGG